MGVAVGSVVISQVGSRFRRCGQDDKKIRLLIEGGIQWRVNIFLLGIEWAGGLRGAWALVAWWVNVGKCVRCNGCASSHVA